MRVSFLELFIYIILPTALRPCNRNEYQHGVGLTTSPPSRASCLEIWEPQPPGTLRACTGIAVRFTFLIQSSEGEFLVNQLPRLLLNSWRYKHCSKARISVFMLAFFFIFIFYARLPLFIYILCSPSSSYLSSRFLSHDALSFCKHSVCVCVCVCEPDVTDITTAENRVRSKARQCAAWSIKWQMDRFSSRVIWLNVKHHSTDQPYSFNHLLPTLRNAPNWHRRQF